MPKAKAQEQITKSVAAARSKGSQRIVTYAMIDKDSYVKFFVPEWFVVLVGADEKVKAGTINAGAKLWTPKAATKEAQTADSTLPATGGTTTTNKRIVRNKLKGQQKSPIASSTFFVGRQVKLFMGANSPLRRGTKPYTAKTLRVHANMNDTAVKYYLQQLGLKTGGKITGFGTDKVFYPIDDFDVQIADLGQLRDNDGAVTAK